MRKVAKYAYAVGLLVCLMMLVLHLVTDVPPLLDFVTFVIWTTCMFGMMSLTMGNLNALAMEPVGHIAGFAASMIGALSTVVSVIVAAPIGLAFDGTPLPLIIGSTLLLALSLGLMKLLD